MADEKWSGFDIEISTTGTYVMVLYPDGLSASGYKNAQITIANFFSSIQSQITTNTGDISTNTTNITTLQNNSSKRLDSTQTVSYSYTQAADSIIEQIFFKGTGTVSVGTTLAGVDIMSLRLIENGLRSGDISSTNGYTATSRTVYITLSAASVDVAIFSKLSLFTP